MWRFLWREVVLAGIGNSSKLIVMFDDHKCSLLMHGQHWSFSGTQLTMHDKPISSCRNDETNVTPKTMKKSKWIRWICCLGWFRMKAVQSNGLETFEHFKARVSLPPPPQSSVRQNESLSEVGRRAGSTHGAENQNRFWNPPTGRASVARTGVGRTTGLKRSFADKYCFFIETSLFAEGQSYVTFVFK